MEKEQRLEVDEVMALAMTGWPVGKIRSTTLEMFDKELESNQQLEKNLNKANEILDRQEALGIISLSCHDDDFPERLLNIGEDCPAVVHCLGNVSLLEERKAVAVIGARAADREGNAMAYKIGKEYAENGNVIVSGLALGCDTSAHIGCLDARGKTIAIVGNGLDLVHPKENVALRNRILEKDGLLLSEQVMGVKANPTRLIARNRLQAALSEAVILAQCPEQSGSMHTMRFARQYGRQSLAATFARRSEANAGNYYLIDNSLAKPL